MRILEHGNQGNDVGRSNEHCPLTPNFDAKQIPIVKQRPFDCHILAPVIKTWFSYDRHDRRNRHHRPKIRLQDCDDLDDPSFPHRTMNHLCKRTIVFHGIACLARY